MVTNKAQLPVPQECLALEMVNLLNHFSFLLLLLIPPPPCRTENFAQNFITFPPFTSYRPFFRLQPWRALRILAYPQSVSRSEEVNLNIRPARRSN